MTIQEWFESFKIQKWIGLNRKYFGIIIVDNYDFAFKNYLNMYEQIFCMFEIEGK